MYACMYVFMYLYTYAFLLNKKNILSKFIFKKLLKIGLYSM